MVVERLAVLQLRNLAERELELDSRVNLLWGPNGAGKTNLLEAVYMSLVGRSCRTRDDRETIAFGHSLARSRSTVVADARRREFMLAVTRAEGRRHLIDGNRAGPEAAALRPPVAVFMPDRLALVKGPPAGRRDHADALCAALWPARSASRRRYARALAQRNALLGRIRAGAAGASSLDAWDRELACSGAELIEARREVAGRIAEPFERAAGALGLDEAQISYRPRSRADGPEPLEAELAARRDSDIARGYTGAGPHLDEFPLEAGGRALRRYGSQGQQRTALLALLFAEREVLLEEGRPPPLMLLDDVSSELDRDRRRLLVDLLAEGDGQALITATDRDALPPAPGRTEIAIRAGAPLTGAPGAGRAAA